MSDFSDTELDEWDEQSGGKLAGPALETKYRYSDTVLDVAEYGAPDYRDSPGADGTAAVNSAIDDLRGTVGGTIKFPYPVPISDPDGVDATGLWGVTFEATQAPLRSGFVIGSGDGVEDATIGGLIYTGADGGKLMDATGSHGCEFSFALASEPNSVSSDAPDILLLIARADTENQSEEGHTFEGFVTSGPANVAHVYNVAKELSTMQRCSMTTSSPSTGGYAPALYHDAGNSEGVTSAHGETIDPVASLTRWSYVGNRFRGYSADGTGVLIKCKTDAAGHQVFGDFYNPQDGEAAFEFEATSGTENYGWTWMDPRMEQGGTGSHPFIQFEGATGGQVQGFRLTDGYYGCGPGTGIVDTVAGLDTRVENFYYYGGDRFSFSNTDGFRFYELVDSEIAPQGDGNGSVIEVTNNSGRNRFDYGTGWSVDESSAGIVNNNEYIPAEKNRPRYTPENLSSVSGGDYQVGMHNGTNGTRGPAYWDPTAASGAGNWISLVDGTEFGPN
jgi:hypothetical protein